MSPTSVVPAVKSDHSTIQKKCDVERAYSTSQGTKTKFQWRWIWILVISLICIVCITTLTFVIVTWTFSSYFSHECNKPPTDGSSEDQRTNVSSPGNCLRDTADNNASVLCVERNEWGAMPPTNPLTKLELPVPYVIISHTATDFCTTKSECVLLMRFIQVFQIESRHFSDISYNFIAGGDGLIYVGRSWDYVGAHSFGYNNKSIGISFIGTFNTVVPPQAQLDAVQKLLQLGVEAGKISPDYKLLGQRQISKTLSPGDALYNIIKKWPQWSPNP